MQEILATHYIAFMEKMLVAGCWILVFKGNYPYFIQHQASHPLWHIRSFSAVGSKFRVQSSKLKSDIILSSTWNVER